MNSPAKYYHDAIKEASLDNKQSDSKKPSISMKEEQLEKLTSQSHWIH